MRAAGECGGSLAQTGPPNPVSITGYNANNQLTTWGTANLGYDANGNMTSDGVHSYAWDARNRLATMDFGNTASFAYDPFGRRTSKTIVGAQTGFLYDGANPVQELSGSTPTANLLTGGLDEYFSRTDSAGARNFLTDALGSTLALTDSTGATQTSYTFDPFGNTTSAGAASANSFQYTSRENDGTGLYFYRARYYNPQLQRFISEDPAELNGGINFYAYVDDNPIIFVDPTGLCQCLNLNNFVNWLDRNAGPFSTGRCAHDIRLGLQAGGGNTNGAPVPARDYGPFLINNLGFSQLPQDPGYSPQVGDIAVFQPFGTSAYGHIEAWDGSQWVSDWKQPSFWPNRHLAPYPYNIYRYFCGCL